jgi:hypothetical protein
MSHRDATMILLAYRHGLRAAELVSASLTYGRTTAITTTPHLSLIPMDIASKPIVKPIVRGRGDLR